MQWFNLRPVAALPAAFIASFSGPAAAHGGHDSAAPIGWTWEPWVLVCLGCAIAAYLLGARRMSNVQRRQILSPLRYAAFAGGIVTLFIALVSPLDALADTLFSAHMTQHLLLLLVAPPLLVYSRPVIVSLWAFDINGRRAIGRAWMRTGLADVFRLLTRPMTAWLLLSFVLWFWHLPTPYAWALNNEAVHVIEHMSFLATSLAFWTIVIEPYGSRRALGLGATLLYVASIGFQNGLLGALLTFATRPLYPIVAAATSAYGLTPLEDQQLAGVIMWVPASAIHLWTLCALFMAWLTLAERRASAMNMTLSTGAVRCALVVPVLLVLLSGCSDDATQPTWQVAGGDARRGPALIHSYSCGACHTIPDVAGADGNVGPPLTGIGERLYVAGVLRNTPDNLVRWIRFPQCVVSGNAMPDLGVTEQDARDITAYLYTLR